MPLDDSPLLPNSPPEESSPAKASTLPPSLLLRGSSPIKINDSPIKIEGTLIKVNDSPVHQGLQSLSPLLTIEDDALPVMVQTPSPAPPIVSVERSALVHSRSPSRTPSAIPSRLPSCRSFRPRFELVLTGASRAHYFPLFVTYLISC